MVRLIRKTLLRAIICVGTFAAVSHAADTDIVMAFDAYERGQYVVAQTHFRKAAQQGDVQAQETLGLMYALGMPTFPGIQRDPAESIKWLRLASSGGRLTALYLHCAVSRKPASPQLKGTHCFDRSNLRPQTAAGKTKMP